MYPPRFDYHRATSLEEARSLLAEHADRDPRLLAGGHSLIPALKTDRTTADVLVDLGGIDDLEGVTTEPNETIVGALTTYADLLEASELAERHPVLTDALAEVGDLQVRNRGTLGGNLAQAEPAADLPAAVLAANATIVAHGSGGEREIRADEFFRGERETALETGEVLTRVRLPAAPASDADRTAGAYVRKTHPASGWASLGVAVVLECEGESVREARLAATGVTDRAIRLESVEDALAGEPLESATVAAAAERAAVGIEPDELRSDLHVSGEYRAGLVPVYVERALERAAKRIDASGNGGEPR
ncbi:FAD binding domain-containing protein [Natrononativus amylolyticus]|uniref:FAD binding domain-containing protein n=1 Tax=Natrononativus amylolyticus TaxID=2963434 RepID=UPI0020CFD5B8|nr:xanthine dehydrogenase family protein subunit M [Natrononativus amylolyticus]